MRSPNVRLSSGVALRHILLNCTPKNKLTILNISQQKIHYAILTRAINRFTKAINALFWNKLENKRNHLHSDTNSNLTSLNRLQTFILSNVNVRHRQICLNCVTTIDI